MKEKITASILVICLLMSYLVTFSNIYVIYAGEEDDQIVFEAKIVNLREEKESSGQEKYSKSENTKTDETNKTQSDSENVTETASTETTKTYADETEEKEKLEDEYVLRVKVGIKENGYLKNSKIEVEDLENQIFKLKEVSNPIIQSYKKGAFKLNIISAKEEYELEIPLEIKTDDAVNISSIQNGTKVKLTGTYMNEDAESEKIEKEITTAIELKNERNIGIGSNIEKYITYKQDDKEYAVIQLKINVEETNEDAILPTKSTDLKIKLPEITVEDGKEKPELIKTTVMAKNTGFTNGKNGQEVKFSEENYKIEKDGRLNIHLENEEKDGKYLKPNGKDEYLIELIYNNAQNIKTREVKSEIEAKIEIFDGKENKTETGILEQTYKLDEAQTSQISYEVKNLTEKLSKGKIYANVNKEEDLYETEYKTEISLNISRANNIKSIDINETEENYITEDGSAYSSNTEAGLDTYYKTTVFNRDNLLNIIGENGNLEILNEKGESLIKVDKTIEGDEEGNVVLGYPNKIGKIVIRINNPEKSGILNIQNTKAIGKSNYTKESLVAFKALTNKYVATAIYDENIETELGVVELKTELTGTKTKAEIEVSRENLSTLVKNENVQFTINLNNSKEDSDMYIDPEFEITLPQGIQTISIKDVNVLYGNEELKIAKSESRLNEDNKPVIYIKLEGIQKTFSLGDSEKGTSIIVNADITLDRYLSNRTENVVLRYINQNSTEYGSKLVDNVPTENIKLNFVGQTGLVAGQKITGYKDQEELISMNQRRPKSYNRGKRTSKRSY